MKLQINTKEKSITLQEGVKAGQLITLLKAWFPNGEWKGWTLNSETVMTWTGLPTYIYPYRTYQPFEIWYGDTITGISSETFQVSINEPENQTLTLSNGTESNK